MYAAQVNGDNSGNEKANTNDDTEKTLVHLVKIRYLVVADTDTNIHRRTGDSRDDARQDE